jgi:hypothetical protein
VDSDLLHSSVASLNEAESTIQTANGRGGVSWVLCGQNAANIFRNTKGFQPAAVVAPIGAHIIGYLRDPLSRS